MSDVNLPYENKPGHFVFTEIEETAEGIVTAVSRVSYQEFRAIGAIVVPKHLPEVQPTESENPDHE